MAFVLVVDDDPVFREIAREILIEGGHEVATAEDGVKALKAVEARPPDLAVVDMLMPNRDGIETLGDLRRRWPEVKVIIVSGGARLLDRGPLLNSARGLGADATLGKPLDRLMFLDTVRQVLA
jgi:CheY-like chemotaxis protein